ncbi:two component LuxR family transcriptional regulator [Galbibacter marinus]|uniref:Two component LuxR family transcriptional regulator n=1 Tax=Galbibacter marinus TaxID=555500 RepID=K2P4H9_9FLAO|nr:response regulator transcription factor [Galbibacter marinus]EKF55928.1 two component LuxR family transcriptional regulator [Galbibacter marinus]
MIKVLVADNHPIVRIGLKNVLQDSEVIEIIGNVSTTSELFGFLVGRQPDVIILEMDIPEVNGITALRRIKRDFPDIKIVIFSSQPEEVYALSTIKAGASGYISKTASLDTITTAILKVAQGGMFITNELAQRIAFDESSNKPRKFFRKLSSREIEVLKLLARGRRNKQVAEELGLNEKTVSTYKARLMKKLNVDNMVDMLQQAKALELY